MISFNAAAAIRRPAPPPSHRLLDGSVREPVGAMLQFNLVEDVFDNRLRAHAVYRVEQGMTFRAEHHVDTSRLLATEAKRADFDLCRACLTDIVMQVREYNAAILPIPND